MSRPDIERVKRARRWISDYAESTNNGVLAVDLRALLDYVAELEEENGLLAEQNRSLDAKLSWFDGADA